MKKIIILSLFVAIVSGCGAMKNQNSAGQITLSGTIEKLGMSTFQYGTHIIKTENKTYALKSNQIKLDSYLDKKVTITGNKVAGYPLEGGPELIDVTLIKF
ncbi:hypothetical protein [Pedobacter mucosus]|uniref:hypothetical protein n=1 Tax=Pedobacter mucosus TaxID=2895286 RepID=UPI001EE4DB37|nr:hypothetical protein [Pedobacter mucosus]UKT62200.1 hypothetical protein LOK61_10545 [Pedobacter mucosus]